MTYTSRLYTLNTADNRGSSVTFHVLGRYHTALRHTYTVDGVKKLIGVLLKHGGMLKIFGTQNEDAYFLLAKKGRTYFLNGQKISMENAAKVTIHLVGRLNSFEDAEHVDDTIDNILEVPIHVTEAVVNKIHYQYLAEQNRSTALLDVRIIGKDTAAIQIYSDMWIPLSFKDLGMFIKSCKGSVNKFYGISPQELYHYATEETLTPVEVKTVFAYLEQNKKNTLVTKRSMELVDKLSTGFKNIHKLEYWVPGDEEKPTYTGLMIRGTCRSWLIYHGHDTTRHITGRQSVKTSHLHHVIDHDAAHNGTHVTDGKNDYYIGGSICIDQSESNVSLGDQLASRAMLVLNDKANAKNVSTMRSFNFESEVPRHEEVITDGVFKLRRVESEQ